MTRVKHKHQSAKSTDKPTPYGLDKADVATAPTRAAIATALVRYQSLLSPEEYALLLNELNKPLPQAIRANPLKVLPEEAIKRWSDRYGWTTQPVPYEPSGWQILSSGQPISQTIEHRLGLYYIQDAASMLPATLLDLNPSKPELILDMAASPGGKTTHLISRTNDRSLIIANDSTTSRINALRIVLQNWGGINTAITNYPGEQFAEWFPDTFDRILLDAPCSMQSLRSSESHPMRPISENERRSLSQRQVRLLESAFLATRPGGQVVYATCTLAPEEDEAVVDHLLRKFPGNAQVADVSTHLPAPASGLTMDGERKFSPELKKSLRLWPHRFGTSGFFSALIIKNDKVYGKQHQLQPINFPAGNENFQSLSPRQKAELVDRLNQDYGFNLSGLINEQNLALIRQPTALGHINTFLVSNLWFDRFNGFRYTNLGLLLGREINGFFELSHEFSARFGAGFTNGSCLIPDDMVDRWCTGHDLEGSWMSEKLKNPIVIVTDNSGRILGRGRIQANRLKNLIPKRLI